ncbi:MAG: pyridoxine 5'-phosphate synthase [Gemmatimonadetes bacterium]|nr:pyridoxine 5'-phosphate synthase [Gemmatimonadota bacterium]MBL0180327.1 pyridoxine 5'-phosphate synthase [Gemmatimonadota bacterium]
MRPLRLYINVDHVATLREARRTDEPDPRRAAAEAEAHGADGITVHLREDRRHIQDHDVEGIAAAVTTVCNLELATREDIVDFACRLRPYQVTIVPERREEVTTEGGLDLARRDPYLRTALRRLDAAGIHVALFIDPDISVIDEAKDLGVPAIELHTGRYAHGWHHDGGSSLAEVQRAAEYAAGIGLAVHAGHGLTYANVLPIARIPEIEELNIGHSVVSRAIFEGIGPAVRTMKRLCEDARA